MNNDSDNLFLIIMAFVAGFIIFILIWPLIDPTPDKSSSLKENIQKATGK